MTQARKSLARFCGLAALVGTILPPLLFMLKLMPHNAMQQVMLVAAIVWFVAAPFWLKVE
jgi:hypothetical protein